MGWFIRKSFGGRGPIRVNVSKSGVGFSVGVTGFRVGTGPRGQYLHAGRYGLYYRKQLGNKRTGEWSPTPESTRNLALGVEEARSTSQFNSAQMVHPETEEFAGALASVQWSWRALFWPLLALWLLTPALPNGGGGLAMLAFIAAMIPLGLGKYTIRKMEVEYEMDETAAARFEKFGAAVQKLRGSQILWEQKTAARVNDWKRNAGADENIDTKPARIVQLAPAGMKTSLRPWAIEARKRTFHFMPDYLIITERTFLRHKLAVVPYGQLDYQFSTYSHIDPKPRPRDSTLVGHTWRYVRRDGGPDRRFSNNKQLPKYQFGSLHMVSAGFELILLASNAANLQAAHQGFNHIASQELATAKRPKRSKKQASSEAEPIETPVVQVEVPKLRQMRCPKCKHRFKLEAGAAIKCPNCGLEKKR